RTRFLQYIRNYVAEYNPVPPMPMADVKVHADKVVEMLGCDPIYRDYIGVLINNEMWRDSLAAIPYERRLLLLPKCLRVESKCPAPFDEFGLLCKQCGLCSIQDLQNEAERLGYAVLVAEGSAIVMSLIQTGKIEAIVGVSCLSVLERAFPYMEAAAVPGVAVPLLQDDCIDTTVDLDWIWDYIHLTSEDRSLRLDLVGLREEVDFCFTPASLDLIMGAGRGETEQLGREWLMRAGKRWRPFLAASVVHSMTDTKDKSLSEDLKKICVAVECFHKASLIHDDIEDNDDKRYGEQTLHASHGIALALNVGDLLIGEGYRLIADTRLSPEQKNLMLQIASEGHRQLCRGQGAELSWMRSPVPMKAVEVLDIFRSKTAPAFEVALQMGAVFAGVDVHAEVKDTIHAYSEALGIAYQIRDDLSDHGEGGDTNDLEQMRPNLPMAIAYEKARDESKEMLETAWKRELNGTVSHKDIESLCADLKAIDRSEKLLEAYKEEAIRSIAELDNPSLKGLLRRLIGKIFNDTEIKGWCGEVVEDQLHAPQP
ncbi:polyprenyl synthetase family protein, partial [Verrucomicrobia bacterium]|nr:polyprenyl synthetase family protein [Verrucomicrobiota bacterium]